MRDLIEDDLIIQQPFCLDLEDPGESACVREVIWLLQLLRDHARSTTQWVGSDHALMSAKLLWETESPIQFSAL